MVANVADQLPAFAQLLAPKTSAEAARNRREIEHIRAIVSIKYGDRLPLATVGETIKRNAYREHVAISDAVLALAYDGQDVTEEGMQ